MTWLHIPPQSISAPATEGLSLPCDRGEYALWLTLSGTATQRPSSWNGWNKRDWIKPLFGTTSRPLMANLGAAEWISSLPVSPANRSPTPAHAVDLTMTVGSGLQSQELSLRYDLVSLCWRTCHQLFEQDYPLSSQTLPNSGSMRNGDCTPQPTLVPLIEGNDGGAWPTPRAIEAPRSSAQGTAGPTLTEAAVGRDPTKPNLWPTPVANDCQGSVESHMAQKAKIKDGSTRTQITSLNVMSKLWPTPRANDDNRSPEAHLAFKERTASAPEITSLNVMSKLWPTPQAADGYKIGSMTPETAERRSAAGYQEMLASATVMWPTPKAHDGKAPRSNTSNRQSPDLHDIVSHQHATTPQPGHDGSPKVDLNPWFVASLMGLPPDWLTHSTSAVTALCHKQQQQQSDNYLSVAGGNYE